MSLENELRTEQVAHLDLSGFSRVASGASVADTLHTLQAERHNVCLVTDGSKLIGIFTERDALRKVVDRPESLAEPIDDYMTPDPVTVTPSTSAAAALQLMDDHRFRNLPVVDAQGKIVGNMTHQAIIDFLAARYAVEILNLPPHVERYPRKAEGG